MIHVVTKGSSPAPTDGFDRKTLAPAGERAPWASTTPDESSETSKTETRSYLFILSLLWQIIRAGYAL
jgi:hypothetical protein